MDKKPIAYYEVFELFLKGWNYLEISNELGCSIAAVESCLNENGNYYADYHKLNLVYKYLWKLHDSDGADNLLKLECLKALADVSRQGS